MMDTNLSETDRNLLLHIAREAIECAVRQEPLPELDLVSLSPALQENGASFVTLTEEGDLRGCIGALEAYQPLAVDVQEHAVAAAMEDYRFSPVRPEEIPSLEIEISRLTAPKPLDYDTPQDLIGRLRPHVDGVILRDGIHRATFLPQVWEKLPEPEEFLSHLCSKMGSSSGLWRHKKLQVFIYQVEEWQEVKK